LREKTFNIEHRTLNIGYWTAPLWLRVGSKKRKRGNIQRPTSKGNKLNVEGKKQKSKKAEMLKAERARTSCRPCTWNAKCDKINLSRRRSLPMRREGTWRRVKYLSPDISLARLALKQNPRRAVNGFQQNDNSVQLFAKKCPMGNGFRAKTAKEAT